MFSNVWPKCPFFASIIVSLTKRKQYYSVWVENYYLGFLLKTKKNKICSIHSAASQWHVLHVHLDLVLPHSVLKHFQMQCFAIDVLSHFLNRDEWFRLFVHLLRFNTSDIEGCWRFSFELIFIGTLLPFFRHDVAGCSYVIKMMISDSLLCMLAYFDFLTYQIWMYEDED